MPPTQPERPPIAWGVLSLVALVKLAVHLPALVQYGWFRDELYYLVCADHLSLGYVDQPPLSLALLAAWRAAFGESLPAVRMLPVVLGLGVVYVTGWVARELGGGRVAQGLAALAVVATPVFLALHHFYSMNAVETLLWPLATWWFLRATRTGATRDWLGLGAVLGLGLLNKISILWLGAGLAAVLVLTPARAALRTRGPYLAAAIAGLLFAPHVLWQAQHGWPTLEFMANAAGRKMVDVTAADFVRAQIMQMNPLLLPLWLAGLLWGVAGRAGRAGRAVALIYLVAAAILLVAGRSRASYLAPAYVGLFAAGAVSLERGVARLRAPVRRALVAAAATLIVLVGALSAPAAIPVLPLNEYVAYARRLGLTPSTEERQRIGILPQHYADMFGWFELTRQVERAYRSLTPAEQARVVIFGQNYGEAGAVTVIGRSRGLPPAISGHNSYWLWGPGHIPQDPIFIVIGGDADDNAQVFEHIDIVGHSTSPYAMPYEQDLPISIGRHPKVSITELWPRLKHFI